MLTEQLSIFIENKEGSLAEVTAILQNAGICICALQLADTSDFAVLRLIVNDNAAAEAALKAHGFIVGKSEVIAVEIANHRNGLNQILDPLCAAGINLEYIYSFHHVVKKHPIMIFRVNAPQNALETLKKHNITIVPPENLCS